MRMPVWLLVLASVSAHADTLVVVSKADDNVSLIDLASGITRTTVPVGAGPHEVALSPDGRWGLVTHYGRGEPGNTLGLIDIAGGQLVDIHSLGDRTRPHGVVWDDATAWLTVENEGPNGALVAVDPVDGTVLADIASGQAVTHMVALHPDGRRAYTTNIADGSVSVYDRATRERLAIVPASRGAEGIAVSPDGSELWVANQDSSDISVYATDTMAEIARVIVHGRPIRIAFTPDGSRALVACARTNDLAVLDVAQRSQITRVRFDHEATPGWPFGLAPSPVGVLVSPDGSRAYVALVAADQIAEVGLDDYGVRRLLQAGNQPDGMAWSRVDVAQP